MLPRRSSAKSGSGYFTYYEGPLTETTYGDYGAEPVRILPDGRRIGLGSIDDADGDTVSDFFDADIEKGQTYRRFSKLGDVDDVIAFTAEARGDDWFTGKVPRYLVDDSIYTDTNTNGVYDPGEPIDQFAAMEPTIIRSKYAEIIMWASPEWSVDRASHEIEYAAHPSGMPRFRDDDRNLIPDRVVLHQRILLIRPDLNVRRQIPTGTATLDFESSCIRPLLNQALPHEVPNALRRIYPIGLNVNNPADAPPVFYGALHPDYKHPDTIGNAADHQRFHASNFLVGWLRFTTFLIFRSDESFTLARVNPPHMWPAIRSAIWLNLTIDLPMSDTLDSTWAMEQSRLVNG